MAGDEKPKKKKRRLVRTIGSVLSLAALTYVAIILITGRGFDLTWFTDLFATDEQTEMADEFIFDVGRDRVFAGLGDSLASAGTLGIQVLDMAGGETLRDPFRMSGPALDAKGGTAVAFDIGGTAVRVFDKTRIISSLETENTVVSASINKNGWLCVCTQGSGGYKSVATVYNNKGNEVYIASLSSGYILSAELSDDNKSLAVLNLTENGSRVTIYNGLSSETADCAFDLPGGLILDIRYLQDGKLAAITTQSLIAVDKNGEGEKLYDFSGKRLGAYAYGDDFYALYMLDYSVGYRGQLVTLGADGSIKGERPTDREIVSMSSCGGYLAVLRDDGAGFYNDKLEEQTSAGQPGATTGSSLILALEGGAALVAGDHSAIVFRTIDEATTGDSVRDD